MKGACLALAAVVAVGPLACGGSPAAPSATAKLGEAFTVENGGEPVLVDGVLRIRFEELLADSRCPVDVNCIVAGDAAIRVSVGVGKQPELQLTLHTRLAGGTSREADIDATRRLTLIDLTPLPNSNVRISPSEYTATLKVTAR